MIQGPLGLKALEYIRHSRKFISPLFPVTWPEGGTLDAGEHEPLYYFTDRRIPRIPHRSPSKHCHCGIHASLDTDTLSGYGIGEKALVVVEGQGRWFLHERGWRAAHAEVVWVIGWTEGMGYSRYADAKVYFDANLIALDDAIERIRFQWELLAMKWPYGGNDEKVSM